MIRPKHSLLILYIACLTSNINAQIVNIPDVIFKSYLLMTAINTNGDDEIQVSEAEAIESLDISLFGISDLTGIEAFTSLTYLNCSSNSLNSLDVTSNTALTSLTCYENSLNSLDVSNNTSLTYLNCYDNTLTSLYVNNNPLLASLGCSDNCLTSLDVSNNPLLTALGCGNNSLNSLDVRNGNNSGFFYFSAYNNPDLNCISVDDVDYATTNWTEIDNKIIFSTDCLLSINENEISSFIAFPNPTSDIITINSVQSISFVTITDVVGNYVYDQTYNNAANKLTLDLSTYTNGVYFVKFSTANHKEIIIKVLKK